jgi:acetyl esterase/lipase
MKQSLSYYLILLIIKLKGLKKDFSQDPIDFKKIRKQDVHEPKGSFFKQNSLRKFKVMDSSITEIGLHQDADQLLLFIHGGAFISGPSQSHWDAAKKMATTTKHKVWMCDYPKSPENKISNISANIDAIYQAALEQFDSSHISLIGDSVGGTLITSLTQRLVENNMPLPKNIILVTPVMDASLTNTAIDKVDLIDPMLSKKGVLSAKRMCAEEGDLKNSMISPLFGRFENFPHTVLFIAENDIFYPDQQLAVIKMKNAQTNLTLIEGKNMLHIWPFLPVMKEAGIAMNEIIRILNH